MDTPGIEIKPIITLAGDHEVNQTFFDDVKVPVENVVGEENDGWTVAKYLLEFERGGGYAASLQEQARRIKSIASKERSDSGESLLEDKNFSRALNEVEIEVQAVLMTEHRIMSDIAERGHPGPASSILKSRGSELKQTLDELAVTAMGYYTLPLQNEARKLGSNFEVIGPDYGVTIYPQYLNNRASTIYGGSNEIQKNIMAKFVLGL
jgi:acyl-CoA dehydrogenase